jgi:hypothetical protein
MRTVRIHRGYAKYGSPMNTGLRQTQSQQVPASRFFTMKEVLTTGSTVAGVSAA